MKNKILMIPLILGIVLIFLGLLLYFSSLNFNTDNDNKSEKNESLTQEKNPNTTENLNEGIKKEKCLNDLCIKDLSITNQAGIYSISATLTNTGTTIISDKAINLVFSDKEENKITTTYYIIKIEGKKALPLEIQFTEEDKDLMTVIAYEIEESSQEEYNKIKNNVVN